MHPLLTQPVAIDKHCIGDRWSVQDESRLAALVAIVAMGQATRAAQILKELIPAAPAFTTNELRLEAKIPLTIQENGNKPRTGYPRWQRDGFVFEVISWIAARQTLGELAYLKAPHIRATSQGLDGLLVELSEDKKKIVLTTIFEDKCTDNPRETFLGMVLPAFLERHENKRSAELVSSTTELLGIAGIDDADAAKMVAAVMDRNLRRYRAAFALTDKHDNQSMRQKLFKGYDALTGLPSKQRVGAGLIVDGNLRQWLDALALQAIAYLDTL